jgi:3-hydroxybutyrate dehydrogenase
MLNGFGEASAIENERKKIAEDFGVRVAFNPADLSKPAEVVQMIEATTRELIGHSLRGFVKGKYRQRNGTT